MVAADEWINQPAGFTLKEDGKVVAVRPLVLYLNLILMYEAVF